MRVISRSFLAFFTAVAALGLIAGGGCTKRGHITPSPTPPAPETIYVSSTMGNDTTGNGSVSKPFKSLTRAVDALPSTEPFNDTISMAPGDYNAANGEKFPIAIPTGVTISSTNYGNGVKHGAFIDGYGEDTGYEQLAGVPAHSLYATMHIDSMATGAALSDVYIGTSTLKTLPAGATYVTTNVLGGLTATAVSFGAKPGFTTPNAEGVLVPSGTLQCTNCVFEGAAYGIAARTIPSASAPPQITLSGAAGQSLIESQGTAILTDGSADLTISAQSFSGSTYAYADTLAPAKGVTIAPGIVDFGSSNSSCGNGSAGGNVLAGARVAEIYSVVPESHVCAYNDSWNQGHQGATKGGVYKKPRTFGPGSDYNECLHVMPPCNVLVESSATGTTVTVGPYVAPTTSPSVGPTPTPTPTGSATASASPSP